MHKTNRDDDTRMTRGRVLALVLTIALTVAMIVVAFPEGQPRLTEITLERVPESGVENPVTAVLLNFRGYDTLLEVGVLLLTVIGIWSIARKPRIRVKQPNSPVLAVFVRSLLPLMVIVAAYLLWLGADAPGGAFQGGAVLGGMGILLVAAITLKRKVSLPMLRFFSALGLMVFIIAAVGLLLVQGAFLQYPPAQAKTLILIIESAATLSIGLTLTMLFIGGMPEREDHQ